MTSSEAPGNSRAGELWRDLVARLSEFYEVRQTEDRGLQLHHPRTGRIELLLFGPEEWYRFVTQDPVYEVHPDLAAKLRWNPSWAIDDLSVVLGSKGSPLVIRDGRLERE